MHHIIAIPNTSQRKSNYFLINGMVIIRKHPLFKTSGRQSIVHQNAPEQ